MRKTLLLTLVVLCLPAVAMAQWEFQNVYPTQEELQFSSAHGIAVDPDGKVWVQYFGATDSVQVEAFTDSDPEGRDGYRDVRVLYVFNPDGSEADISPIRFIDFEGGERDTLGGFLNAGVWEGKSGRGLDTDADGNILVSQFDFLYKLDYETGAGLAKNRFEDYCSLAAPAADGLGNVYVASVCNGDAAPMRILDADLNVVENAIDVTIGFSRSFAVSPDGNRIYWGGYTNNVVVLYERPDEFSAYDSVGVVIPGMDSESLAFNPATGNLWVASGSTNDLPNDYPGFETNWLSNTWYEFDPASLAVNTIPQPLNQLTWWECETFDAIGACQEELSGGRPRGIAFTPDGAGAYVIQFSETAPSVAFYTEAPFTSVERVGDVPTTIELAQNYPNPFNPSTTIRFGLDGSTHATLTVYDVLGRAVAVLVDEPLAAGTYTATFDATDLATGTYLYVLEAEGQRVTRTMLLVK